MTCKQQALMEGLPSGSHSGEPVLTSAPSDPEVLLGKWAPLCGAGQSTRPFLFPCHFSSQLQVLGFQASFVAADNMQEEVHES